MQFLPLDTSCIFSLLLNDDIIDTEKPDEICSQNFFEDDADFSGIFSHP